MIRSPSAARGSGSSWRRTRSGATANRGRISMAARLASTPHQRHRVGRLRRGIAIGISRGPTERPGVGRFGHGPRNGARRSRVRSATAGPQAAEQFLLGSATPGEDQEWIGVEGLRQEVVDGGDVLARVLPVRTRTGRVELVCRGREKRCRRVGECLFDLLGHLVRQQSGREDRARCHDGLDGVPIGGGQHLVLDEHPVGLGPANPAPRPSPDRRRSPW